MKRWEAELDKPEASSPIYLAASTINSLKYTLAHLTSGDESITLDEAVDLLCTQWITLGNASLRCERKHKPYDALIEKKIRKKHRKCTTENCVFEEWGDCPIYEW